MITEQTVRLRFESSRGRYTNLARNFKAAITVPIITRTYILFNSEFLRRSAGDKYAVFRIYPNNNPIPSIVIGKIIHEIFYIMYIDLNHDMYDG